MEQWYLYCKKADFSAISQKFHISPMLARILRNRDMITEEQIAGYLSGGTERLYDPFLMKGMQEAVQLTAQTIAEGRKIRIMGDYDVDGVCSSYILKTYLEHCGGEVDVRLPNRLMEGYGMNPGMVEEACRDGIHLIITCDNGISANQAVSRAKELGIHVIVTDHHEPPKVLPEADVIIDPKQEDCKYPFSELCGGGVAYKFIQAYDQKNQLRNDMLLRDLLQFAGMATIADIVPLVDENRILAAQGIEQMQKTENQGLLALMEIRGVVKEQLNAEHIGYIIGPCINSAGRLKDAEIALDLFLTNDRSNAEGLASELSDLNDQRKALTAEQEAQALVKLKEREERGSLEKVLVVYLPDAHESVAGIIAGRIKDVYHRPTYVITRSEDGLKGSGRSIDAYNMIEELRKNAELFEKYGGHTKACGFTLKVNGSEQEMIQQMSDVLNASCNLTENDLIRKIWIDMQLPFKYITESFLEELKRLEPFGLKNEKPVFAGKNIKVISAVILGQRQNTLKLVLEDAEGIRMEGVCFGSPEEIEQKYNLVKNTPELAILFYPEINEFRGRKTIQLRIRALRSL